LNELADIRNIPFLVLNVSAFDTAPFVVSIEMADRPLPSAKAFLDATK
jgi:hypothetical protein